MIEPVNLEEQIKKINGKPWFLINIAIVNNQVVRLALMQGEYHWHEHRDEDEFFYVVKGTIVIQLENQPAIILQEGKMAVVPKGVRHCPKSEKGAYVLMFEPKVLDSKGD
ncbi:MAG: cupin domain-containing protein [Patescibacteria group bacterium]|nr:cupin domain-containing protein [Patescibacteria group bacterium]